MAAGEVVNTAAWVQAAAYKALCNLSTPHGTCGWVAVAAVLQPMFSLLSSGFSPYTAHCG
jgi:hypothetical protein